jgi:hypothetical protein
MDVAVAIGTERDQIFVCVVTQQASRAHVVNLETIGTAAVLTSPAVALQPFGAEFAIRIRVQPKLRSQANSYSDSSRDLRKNDQVCKITKAMTPRWPIGFNLSS